MQHGPTTMISKEQSLAPLSTTSARLTHSQITPFITEKKLPPHVEEVLHAETRTPLVHLESRGQGLHLPKDLLPSLDLKDKPLPWETADTSKDGSISSADSRIGRPRSYIWRQKMTTESKVSMGVDKFHKLYHYVKHSPYGKITFTNSNEPMHPMAGWVVHRLKNCRNARFFLPSDYTRLENMAPLDYLEKYVVLKPYQFRRYDLVFTKFMDKQEKCIPFEKLYPALNSMFADSLGERNFKILCAALGIDEEFKVTSRDQFAGICTLTERLFWSSYLESHGNMFEVLGENRSLLECADFCGLKWKIRDIKISQPMRILLFSLA